MSKRAVLLIVLATVVVLVVGAAIGFVWHAPGKSGTWDDARTWVGFVIVVVGITATLIQLNLQRRQLASQQATLEDEITRNHRRDELLDKQLEDIKQRTRLLSRQQAEQIDLSHTEISLTPATPDEPRTAVHMAEVLNRSHRPIRDVSCCIQPKPGAPTASASQISRYVTWSFPGEKPRRTLTDLKNASRIDLVRSDVTVVFVFDTKVVGHPDARVTVRFTDDADLHWQIDHDLRLTPLPDRADW